MKGKVVFLAGVVSMVVCGSWGFLVHRTVNQLAIYELPKPMRAFFWKNRDYLVTNAPRPDIRRNTDSTEAPRHFVDIENYGDSAAWKMPLHEEEAIRKYGADSLKRNGSVPYVIQRVFGQLREAMRARNADSILYYAADLGHYIGDANVPLHTASNYDGQMTGQRGIHSLWETAVPNMDMNSYRLRDGHKARYVSDVAVAVWEAIRHSHSLLDVMFAAEKEASAGMADTVKYRMVTTKYGKTYKAYSNEFAKVYDMKMGRMVNDQLLRSADMIADFWYTAWVDAGRPDLEGLLNTAFERGDRRAFKLEYKAYKRNKLIEKGFLKARLQDGAE